MKKIIGLILTICLIFSVGFIPEPVQAKDNSIKVLCIGNSVTKHPQVPDMWWGDWGMAASTVNTDYVHLLQYYLSDRYQDVQVNPQYCVNWEKDVWNRCSHVPYIDQFLDDNYDVVVIELGENCNELGNFLYDYLYLINYIRWKSPSSEIILVGTITTTWCDPAVEYYKQYAYHLCKYAGYKNIEWVDTTPIMNNPAYWAHMGDLVAGWDFQWHAINNISVALHPSDLAMDFLARSIANKIK